MKKRILSMLLVLAMVLSILPVSVFAAERDSTKEQVRVIVENTVFTPETEGENWDDSFWSGTLVDTWVNLTEDSTIMSCVGAALAEGNYEVKGLDKDYITSVNGLSEHDGGPQSGWMGTLNDWFTDEGFGAYTAAGGTLTAGDEIRILYSKNYGADIGNIWGGRDTSLKSAVFSAGVLEPVFNPGTLEYRLIVAPSAESLIFTPTAANKIFQVHTFAGETEYKRTDSIPVADGTDITVTVGPRLTTDESAEPTVYTFHMETARPDSSAAADWPAFQGGGNCSGVTDLPTPRTAEDMKVLWKKKLSTGWSDAPSPVILADNALFTMCGDTLKKLDTADGTLIASAKMAGATNWGTVPPTFGGGFVFCPLQGGKIQAFRAKDLLPLWLYEDEKNGPGQSPITYDSGKLYAGFGGSDAGGFVCLDAATGELLWRDNVPGGFYWAGAAVIGNYILVGNEKGHLVSRNAETGEIVSDLAVCENSIRSSICISGGKAYFTGSKAQLFSVDVNGETGMLTNLRTADCSAYGSGSTSTPAVCGGVAYLGTGAFAPPSNLVAVDTETMEVLWAIEEPGQPQCSMLVSQGHSDGYIYIYTTYNANPGGIKVIKAKADGTEHVQADLFLPEGAEAQYCTSSLAVDGKGTLYYKNDSGYVFALGLTEEARARQAAEAAIAGIGEINSDSGDAIRAAREAFDALTPEQQKLVCNADVLIAAEKAFNILCPAESTVHLSYAQDDFYLIVPREITISSAASDKYGYVDKVMGSPSTLDCAIKIHEIMLEDAFTPESCREFLVITESGFITKFMGEDTSDIGFSVNGRMPNDGVVNPAYGTCTAYNLNQAPVKSDDAVHFFHYNPAGYYGEIYSVFCRDGEHVTEFTILTDTEETVGTQGYTYLQQGAAAEIKWMPLLPDNQVCTLSMEGDDIGTLVPIEGAVTDDEGNFPLTFAQPGTYYLAMCSNPDMWTYFIPEICKVTVLERQPVLDTIALIEAIGEVTLEREEAVNAARAAYAALAPGQQKLVSNLNVLIAAEARLVEIKDVAVADAEGKINAIGKVTLESEEAVRAARAAYDALPEALQAQVKNYSTLTAAEAALEYLKLPHADVKKVYEDTASYVESLVAGNAPTVGSIGGDWLILGLARDGRRIPDAYYDNVLAFVRENINEKEQLSSSKSTENSRVILALTAMGRNVTNVGGHNLLQGITDMKYLEKQGINGPVWALIAFDSHNYKIPDAPAGAVQVTREGLVEAILAGQLEDGGWKISGDASDPDMTAMALLALTPYCEGNKDVRAAADRGLALLSSLQQEDGGYGSEEGSNAESCAQVLTALTAMGIDPLSDARFLKNGRNIADALCSYFVEGGGFRHLADGSRSGMATEQGYYALVALRRFREEKNPLFDMNDITSALPYDDVKEGAWYADAVRYVMENGLMGGTGRYSFEPESAMTRGMLVTVLYRAAGSPDVAGLTSPFTDAGNTWYTDAVLWAADRKVVNGMEDNRFAPDEPVSREQMVTILFRFADSFEMAGEKRAELDGFADSTQVQGWAKEAMQWAVAEKIIQGSAEDGKNWILPADGATRAEIATVLARFIPMFKK